MKLYSFAKGFKRARKNAGYTQESFVQSFLDGERHEITTLGTVRNWEQGRAVPEIITIQQLCEFFGCDMDYLFNRIECKNHNIDFIHEYTGLSEEAINTLAGLKGLIKLFPEDLNIKDKYRVINLILQDSHQKDSLSSLLDMLVGFCQFSAKNNFLYTADSNGITPFQGKKAASGKGIAYDPSKAHFYLKDMDSMYFLKIWDAVKELKEQYEKAPDTK